MMRTHSPSMLKALDWIPSPGLFTSVKVHTMPLLEVNKIQLVNRSSFQKTKQTGF